MKLIREMEDSDEIHSLSAVGKKKTALRMRILLLEGIIISSPCIICLLLIFIPIFYLTYPG